MADPTPITLSSHRMEIGFQCMHLSPSAYEHESAPAFKRSTATYVNSLVGEDRLVGWGQLIATPFPQSDPDTGRVDDQVVADWANALLAECPAALTVANMEDKCCIWTPPRRWSPCRILPLYSGGDPLTAREVVIDYLRSHQLDPKTEAELRALRLVLRVTWSMDVFQ